MNSVDMKNDIMFCLIVVAMCIFAVMFAMRINNIDDQLDIIQQNIQEYNDREYIIYIKGDLNKALIDSIGVAKYKEDK